MLRWQRQHGKSAEKWAKDHAEGRAVPPSFLQQPELAIHLRAERVAFSDLSTERQIGMGLGPIPRSKIIEYGAAELGLDGDELDRFCRVIRRVDADYLDSVNTPRAVDDESVSDKAAMTDVAGVERVLKSVAKKKPKKRTT